MCSTGSAHSLTRSSSLATSIFVLIVLTTWLPDSSPIYWLLTALLATSGPRRAIKVAYWISSPPARTFRRRRLSKFVDVGLSDHRLLRWTTSLVKPSPVYTTRTSRPWRRLDVDKFRAALMSSSLCRPDAWIDLDTDALACLYDVETTAILDRLVPARTVTCHR